MAQSEDNRKGRLTLYYGNKNARRTIILFHGYTGGTADFGELPKCLAHSLNARVLVPILPGHGTRVENMLSLELNDYIQWAEDEVLLAAQLGYPIAVGGHSFGAYIAMLSARTHVPVALFTTLIPFTLRYPYSLPCARLLARRKKLWPKYFTRQEYVERSKIFFYPSMPGKGLRIIIEAKKLLQRTGNNIFCPLLSIHDPHDTFAYEKSAAQSMACTKSVEQIPLILHGGWHNIFLSYKTRDRVTEEVTKFFSRAFISYETKNSKQYSKDTKLVTAIVPAYNEGQRIEPVLRALTACRDVSEIIVVDDGSKDPPLWIRKTFPSVHLILHKQNQGKGAAMETGVRATKDRYLFFCDADLSGFLPEHAHGIIHPVTSGCYRMYLGIRSNAEQQVVPLFAINTGERCVLREDWETLPAFYKKGFRVETGLNFFVKKRGGKFGYEVFPYRQTIKEKKYGFWTGMKERGRMVYEIGPAWLRIALYDFWRELS